MSALFVDPAAHSSGSGMAQVGQGFALQPTMTTKANEQNGEAVGFYEQLGFRRAGR